MSAKVLFVIILTVIIFNYMLEQFLDFLNSRYWSDKLPDELNGIYDPERYKKSQEYAKAKRKISALLNTLSTLLIIGLFWWKGFVILDDYLRTITENQILLGLMFFGIIGFVADILSLPFDLYNTFIIEEKFGFNKTTFRTYIFDKLKGWLLAAVLGGGLFALIIWIYLETTALFWLFAWGLIGIFMIFMSMFYSILIVPLFNKQVPLADGELRNAIEKFALKAGFALDNIYVIDGSKRSSKANAYFSGFGPKKRIVLFDTLIQNHTVEELVAILAHEIGHYKKKHTYLGLGISLVQTGLMFFVLSLFVGNQILSEALGSSNTSFHIGVLVFAILYSPVSLVLGLLTNYVSRKHEFEADKFAGEKFNPDALGSALKKLSVNNLSNLKPHPIYVFFYYSHPPLLQRLAALNKIK
ncbi:MAG: peptidase M48 [Bacteroidetes bacterium HGW-Bacteroidetes-17]|nr:MAG: peptidase M48 [Bacteroidetes bacterium HGW-Bacteroidetes-17]